MTHNIANFTPKIALYEPDIPQNTAAIIRTCSCLGAVLEIIEPLEFQVEVLDFTQQLKVIEFVISKPPEPVFKEFIII